MTKDILYPHPLFLDSGCRVLNLALSGRVNGGWAKGRVSNLVGKEASGKTQLAMECAIILMMTSPNARARVHDLERTLDLSLYAKMFPPEAVSRISLGDPEKPVLTVKDLTRCVVNDMYDLEIVDSVDGMTVEAEEERMEQELIKNKEVSGSYGMGKAKEFSNNMGFMLRQIAEAHGLQAGADDAASIQQQSSNKHLMLISQTRMNIGATQWQPKETKSGGKAIDFYSSQIVWLSTLGKLEKTINGQKWPFGVMVKARVSKNKVAWPFREVPFNILFDHGVADDAATINWLAQNKALTISEKRGSGGLVTTSQGSYSYEDLQRLMATDEQARFEMLSLLQKTWDDIEDKLRAGSPPKFWSAPKTIDMSPKS